MIFCAALAAGRAMGDERAKATLDGMVAAIKNMGSYEVSFTVGAGQWGPDVGSYVVSGEKYSLKMSAGEIFSDGKARYEVNRNDKMVSISKPDGDGHSMFSNPARAFDFLDGTFSQAFAGEAKRNGANCNRIRLTAKDGSLMTVELYVDKNSSLPVEVSYRMDDGGVAVTVNVKSVKAVGRPDPARFRFERKNYPGYEVVDFR